MAKRSTDPTSARAVELLVQTLSRHSSLSSGDERAMRKLLHPRAFAKVIIRMSQLR
jgi:hypothetical protein